VFNDGCSAIDGWFRGESDAAASEWSKDCGPGLFMAICAFTDEEREKDGIAGAGGYAADEDCDAAQGRGGRRRNGTWIIKR